MSRHGSGGYERILSVVRAAKGAIRQSEILAGVGWTVLAAGVSLLLLVVLDNLFYLPSFARILLLAAAVGTIGFVFWRRVVKAASGGLSDDAVAVRIEEAAGTDDNGLINALQLGREREQSGLSGAIIRNVIEKGASAAGRFTPGRVVDRKRLFRILGGAGAAVLVVVAYAVLFTEHFAHAVERYAQPTKFVPPVSSTRLIVELEPPGGFVYPGEPLRVSVRAEREVLTSARIHIHRDGEDRPAEMLFDGREFCFVFERVDEPFRFRVQASDAWSPVYDIALRELPGVANLTLTYRYPTYLNLAELTVKEAGGDVRAPVGTRVRVVAELTQPVRSAALRLKDASLPMELENARTVRGDLVVRGPDVWSLAFETPAGTGNPDPVRHRIIPVPDNPPEVSITAPGKDLVVTLPARIPVTVLARDDHGLAGEIHLVTRRGEGGDAAVVARWAVGGEKERVCTQVLELPSGRLRAGDSLSYFAVARDAYPPPGANPDLPLRRMESRSRVFTITVRSPEDLAAEAEAALADLATRLKDLLERELAVKAGTATLADRVADRSASVASLAARADPIALSQSRIGADMQALALDVPANVPALSGLRGALLSLSANEAIEAVRHLRDCGGHDSPKAAVADLRAAEAVEKKIVTRLMALLGQVDALLKRAEEDPEGWVDEKMDEADPDAALRDAIARLKKFIREQEDILKQTREFENKEVDDFTEEDLAKLEKLAAQESELSRFLEDLKDDLSKIPDQDFSNSTLLKELIEAYSEVELAADALTRKSIELAVPLEQSGLELAESLTENIEKWLLDTADRVKWKMEEFDGEYPDVPMTDLPDQLEDLIGDLIEDEEELGEDADDVTAGWADSIDKGAGWGVSDGPISNMSAQGKTGNVLPNSSEVGGRSGEGRSGRSHGEMVEGEATGKGGRRTPTRLTPDPWEGKSVKDSSTDPLGGATGGGKLSGGAAGGLRGPLPPEVKGDLGRLAGNQVSIRQRAERLDRMLKSLHYPSEDLSRSVVLMKELEEALTKGDLPGFSRRHGVLVEQMKGGQTAILEHARVVRDRSQAVPKEIMREMESVDLADLPEGYRDLLREYYKALSRGGGR